VKSEVSRLACAAICYVAFLIHGMNKHVADF